MESGTKWGEATSRALFDLDVKHPPAEQAKLLKAVHEFGSYLRANANRIPNYGERHRVGRRGHLHRVHRVDGQPGHQQAHGQEADALDTPRGAHLLLQIRTRLLNDQLADDFHRWYPNFSRALDPGGARGVASPNLSRSPRSATRPRPSSSRTPLRARGRPGRR